MNMEAKEIKIEAKAFVPKEWDKETIAKRLSEYSFGNVLGEDIIHIDALTLVEESEADLKGLWDEIESQSDGAWCYSDDMEVVISLEDLKTILKRRAISTCE